MDGPGVFLIIVSVGIFILFLVFLLLRRLRKRMKRRRSVCDESPLNHISVRDTDTTRLHTSDRCFATCNPTYMLIEDAPENSHVNFCEHLQGNDYKDQSLKEFRKLPPSDFRPTKIGSLEDNSMKNRYRDVLPFDETRIELETTEDETSDYINASYVKGYQNRITYVAAQGPNIHVTNDFWRMIWQLKTRKIVMLTNLIEKGKIKCEKYWPSCDPEHSTYRKFNIQCANEEVFENYTRRMLKVWKDEEEPRSIAQFHFTAWPDHGVPDKQAIIDFHKLVTESEPQLEFPMLVHCSAGVGRTGTFIALDILLQQAREEGAICIFNCVKELRQQRMKMVQTKEQYKFCYDMIVRALKFHEITAVNNAPISLHCHKCWSEKQKQTHDADPIPDEDSHYVEIWNCGLGHKLKLFQRASKTVSEVGDNWEMCPLLAGITLFMNSEEDLLASKGERLTSEDERLTSEDERLTSEDERLTSEDERLTSEDERLTSEDERLTSEDERLTSEEERLTSEDEDKKVEGNEMKTVVN